MLRVPVLLVEHHLLPSQGLTQVNSVPKVELERKDDLPRISFLPSDMDGKDTRLYSRRCGFNIHEWDFRTLGI